jgi:hypothetical protein
MSLAGAGARTSQEGPETVINPCKILLRFLQKRALELELKHGHRLFRQQKQAREHERTDSKRRRRLAP